MKKSHRENNIFLFRRIAVIAVCLAFTLSLAHNVPSGFAAEEDFAGISGEDQQVYDGDDIGTDTNQLLGDTLDGSVSEGAVDAEPDDGVSQKIIMEEDICSGSAISNTGYNEKINQSNTVSHEGNDVETDNADDIADLANDDSASSDCKEESYDTDAAGKDSSAERIESFSDFQTSVPVQPEQIATQAGKGENEHGELDSETKDIQEKVETDEGEGEKDNGIISVTLPTTFNIPMFHVGNGLGVMSDDITVRNLSSFPVDVKISSVDVSIRQSVDEEIYSTSLGTNSDYIYNLDKIASTSSLKLQLFRYNKKDAVFSLSDGANLNLATFTLGEKGNSSSNDKNSNMKAVDSKDYAVINLRGRVMDGIFLPGMRCDLKVQVTFDFARREAISGEKE